MTRAEGQFCTPAVPIEGDADARLAATASPLTPPQFDRLTRQKLV
jgi:hypothetical protein